MVRRNYNNNKLDLEDGLIVSKDISLREQNTPPASEIGIGKIYAKNDGKIYFLDSSGNEDSFALGSSAGDVTSGGNNIFTGQNTFSNKVIYDGDATSLNSTLIDFTGTRAPGHALIKIAPSNGGQALNIISNAASNNVIVVENTATTGGGIQVESNNSSTSSGAGGALTARNDAGGIGLVVKSGLSRFDGPAEFNSTITLINDPINPLEAATKQYVDNNAGSEFIADSGTPTIAPTASGVDSVAIGSAAVTTKRGQLARSVSPFSTPGDAQISDYQVKAITTDATPTELTLNNDLLTPDRLTMADDTSWGFEVMVVGRDSTGTDKAFFKFTGLIDKVSTNTPTFVGTPIKDIIARSNVSWDADIIIANDALTIQVTGVASTTIHWLANIKTVELTH